MTSKREAMANIRRLIDKGFFRDGKALCLDKVKQACQRCGISFEEFLNYNHREEK